MTKSRFNINKFVIAVLSVWLSAPLLAQTQQVDHTQVFTAAVPSEAQVLAAAAAMREGKHVPYADHYADQIPLAQALIDRLSAASP